MCCIASYASLKCVNNLCSWIRFSKLCWIYTWKPSIPWLFSLSAAFQSRKLCFSFFHVLFVLTSPFLRHHVYIFFPTPLRPPRAPKLGPQKVGNYVGDFLAWLCLVHTMRRCPQDVMVSLTSLQTPAMWENTSQAVRGFSVALRRVEEFSLAGTVRTSLHY